MLTYLMLTHASQLCPGAVVACLDKLIKPLYATVTSKVKPNSVKQEEEKLDELKRAAMRAVINLMNVPGAGRSLVDLVALFFAGKFRHIG